MKKYINKISCSIVLGVLLIIVIIIFTFKLTKSKFEQPEIESLYILGEKINVEPKRKVYRIYMNNAKIEYKNKTCVPDYYQVKFKGWSEEEGGMEFLDDNRIIHIYIKVSKKNNKGIGNKQITPDEPIKQTSGKVSSIKNYDIFIEVNLEKPLEIDSKCS